MTRVRAKGETGLEVLQVARVRHHRRLARLLRRHAQPAHLRQILEVGIGATVIPQQLALPRADDAFEEDGSLKDKAQQTMLKGVVEKLAIAAERFAA